MLSLMTIITSRVGISVKESPRMKRIHLLAGCRDCDREDDGKQHERSNQENNALASATAVSIPFCLVES